MNNNRGFKRNNGPDRRYKKSREEIEMEGIWIEICQCKSDKP